MYGHCRVELYRVQKQDNIVRFIITGAGRQLRDDRYIRDFGVVATRPERRCTVAAAIDTEPTPFRNDGDGGFQGFSKREHEHDVQRLEM